MPEEPQDPVTELMALAAQTHEMFLSYLAAGFTEPQALYLVASVITAGIRPTPPQP
jgi:hypothetical protein